MKRFKLTTEADGIYLHIMGSAFGPFKTPWDVELFTRSLHTFALSQATAPAEKTK